MNTLLARIVSAALLLGPGSLFLFPQSSRPGMGSIPYGGGVTFRVWAPNASAVAVEGDFNAWSQSANPLTSEGSTGLWSADVTGALTGQTYRYVITPNNGSPTVTRRDPYSRQETSDDYTAGNSIIYNPGAFSWNDPPFTAPPLDHLAIYEMHVGTFSDLPGGGPGTFQSAIKGLSLISSLGFNAVEVLPVTEFTGVFSLGYNPTDQLAIENQAYGGPDNFKRFVQACHQGGLAVIVDTVNNHWGPSNLTTNQYDGWWTTQYPGGIYFYDADRWNSPFGPRPNYSDQNIRQYLLDQATMFLTEYHVDGFRWDSISNIYATSNGGGIQLPDGWSLMQSTNAAVKQLRPDAINIAEDLTNLATVTAPASANGAGFDSQWHWFVSTIRAEITQPVDANISLSQIANAMVSTFNGSYTQRVIYTESHNEISNGAPRLTVLIDPADPTSWLARKKSMLAAAVMFTSPGIPMIFQGQEFLDSQSLDPTVPLNWNTAAQHANVRRFYADLVKARLNGRGKTSGLMGAGLNIFQLDDTNKLLVYNRFDPSDKAKSSIVVANFTNTAQSNVIVGFPQPGLWITQLNSDSQIYGADFSNVGPTSISVNGPAFSGMPTSAALSIGPYSILVLSHK